MSYKTILKKINIFTATTLLLATQLIFPIAASRVNADESTIATLPYVDSFGSSNVASTIPNWDEDNGSTSTAANRPGSPTEAHARVSEDGWMRRTVDASGFQDLVLKFYWRGDSDANVNDDAYVQYCLGASCNSGYVNLLKLDVDTQTGSWSDEVTVNLPSAVNDSVFRLRFDNQSSDSDDQLRIDDVRIRGQRIPNSGNLVIVKQIDLDGDLSTTDDRTFTPDWEYDVNGTKYKTGPSGQTDPIELPAGDGNVITEDSTGYEVLAARCSNQSGSWSGGVLRNIRIEPDTTVTCGFVNTPKYGLITVNKRTVPAGDNTQFSVKIQGTGVIDDDNTKNLSVDVNATFKVAYGTYNIQEDEKAGWYVSHTGCGRVVVNDNNPTPSCTITNSKLAKLTIIKDALPNGSQIFDFTSDTRAIGNFSLDDDGDPNNALSNSRTFLVRQGQHEVKELDQAGWILDNIICRTENYERSDNTLIVNLRAGSETICKFTNIKFSSIAGTKFIQNVDGSNANPAQNWIIQLLSGNQVVDQATTDQNGNYKFEGLLPGSYNLIELININDQNKWTQLCAPTGLIVAPGQDVTGQNFCNFENGTIRGFKYEDQNGNGQLDVNEPKLAGWRIRIFKDGNIIGEQTTNARGNYKFEQLAPGVYLVCEVQKQFWTAINPSNGCYRVVIDESGEINDRFFGNRGRGRITVVKHVDHDGDGHYEEIDSTDWNWTIDDPVNVLSTGSDNHQIVWAGSHVITEVQKRGYELVEVKCTGEDISQPNESVNVSIQTGEDVICVFKNKRKTGNLVIVKHVYPGRDSGRFDLNVNDKVYKQNARNGDSTGIITLPTGFYNVNETAGRRTNLDNYNSYYACYRGQIDNNSVALLRGQGTSIPRVRIISNETIICVFKNKRLPQIRVVKDAKPNDDKDFCFTLDEYVVLDLYVPSGLITDNLQQNVYEQECDFVLNDNNDDQDGILNKYNQSVQPGQFIITEKEVEGWKLIDIQCRGAEVSYFHNYVVVDANYGDRIVCKFTNQKYGQVQVTKFNDYDRDGIWDEDEPTLPGWEMNLHSNINCQAIPQISIPNELTVEPYHQQIFPCYNGNYDETQTTDETGSTIFNNVVPRRVHYLSEDIQDGWTWSNTYCNYDRPNEGGVSIRDNYYAIWLRPGEALECFVGNFTDASFNLTKSNNASTSQELGSVVTYTMTVMVPEKSGAVFDTKVIDLPPENFEYINGSWTANSSINGDIKNSPTVEPSYSSPGTWLLGDLVPGEVVVLTYKAIIKQSVTPGSYPDLAFARGFRDPGQTTALFANATYPLVGTSVTVASPLREAGFANTGDSPMVLQFMLPILVITLVGGLHISQRKGELV
jgi:hypothetical protein